MAIRYLKNLKTYQVYWNNPITGKRESKTYKTKKQAEKENSLILYRLKYEQESFNKESKNEKQNLTLREVWLQYLDDKQFDHVNKTSCLCHMEHCLKLLGCKAITEITVDDLNTVRDTFSKCKEIKQATVHKRLVLLRALIYYAVNKGLREPIKFPKIPSANYQKFIPPNKNEIGRMYKVAPEHIKRVLVLGAYFGARVGRCELLQLTWDDVDEIRKVLRIHGSKKNSHSPWREVPIREDILPLFEQWKEKDKADNTRYLISYKGKPVKTIKRAWKKTLEKAGITRRIRPYDLRHAFGTELIAGGADIGTVASLMGHSSPEMLLHHYQYVLDKQKLSAVSLLPKCAFSCASNSSDSFKFGGEEGI